MPSGISFSIPRLFTPSGHKRTKDINKNRGMHELAQWPAPKRNWRCVGALQTSHGRGHEEKVDAADRDFDESINNACGCCRGEGFLSLSMIAMVQ